MHNMSKLKERFHGKKNRHNKIRRPVTLFSTVPSLNSVSYTEFHFAVFTAAQLEIQAVTGLNHNYRDSYTSESH